MNVKISFKRIKNLKRLRIPWVWFPKSFVEREYYKNSILEYTL